MTYTPGPWTVYTRLDEGYRVAVANMAHAVADIDEWRPEEETIANAHLIAAAPDLLAALTRALTDRYVPYHAGMCEAMLPDPHGPCDCWKGQARAAIAAARAKKVK